MNTKYLIKGLWLAGLTLGLASCQNDEIAEAESTSYESAKNPLGMTMTCVAGSNAESRATIKLGNQDTDYEYTYWSAGDTIWVKNLGTGGDDGNGALYTFVISEDYSDDDPQNEATFTCVAVDGEGLYEGDVLCALYLGDQTYDSSWTNSVNLLLDYFTVELDSNSNEEITQYLHDNLKMYGKTTYSTESEMSFTLQHLTTLIRITYTNATEDTQTITRVNFPGTGFGNGSWFNLEEETNGINSSSNWFTQTFENVSVEPDETIDFYGTIFHNNEASEGKLYSLQINYETVYMKSSDISLLTGSTSMTAGYRYWFKVTKTDDGLEWTSYEPSEFDDYLTINDEVLGEALLSQIYFSYTGDDGYVRVPTAVLQETTSLNLSNYGIESIDEILDYLNSINYLYLNNNNLTTIDLSSISTLYYLSCYSNPDLTYLNCSNGNISTLDLSSNTSLVTLKCNGNRLSSLDLCECPELEELYCGNQTDGNGNEQTLYLSVFESQQTLWNDTWSTYDENYNVEIESVSADPVDALGSESTSSSGNFNNGGVF